MRRVEVKRRAPSDRASARAFHYDRGVSRLGSIFLIAVAACASPSMRTVPRVVDGQIEHGPFVSPYAYEWFIEGEVSAVKGRHDEAAMAFETATAAPADDVVLMTRLAEEYELSGESRRADRTLSLAHRYYPDSARVALAEGRIQRSRGQDGEALSSFARAKELAPTWDEPVIAMAQMLTASGRRQRANAVLLEYAGTLLGAPSEHARRVLIDLARRTGDAEILEQVLSLDPSSTPSTRARDAGALALAAGRPALAARILAEALETPENVALWLRALVESGDGNEPRRSWSAPIARVSEEWSSMSICCCRSTRSIRPWNCWQPQTRLHESSTRRGARFLPVATTSRRRAFWRMFRSAPRASRPRG